MGRTLTCRERPKDLDGGMWPHGLDDGLHCVHRRLPVGDLIGGRLEELDERDNLCGRRQVKRRQAFKACVTPDTDVRHKS